MVTNCRKILCTSEKYFLGRRIFFEKKKKVENSQVAPGNRRFCDPRFAPKYDGDPFYKVTSAGSPVDDRTPILGGVFGGVLFSLLYR